MTAFDKAWDIAKEDDPDYSKFGEKFARKIMGMKEGAKGLPEGTKFSDLRSTPPPSYMNVDRYHPKSVMPDIMDLLSGAGSARNAEPYFGSAGLPPSKNPRMFDTGDVHPNKKQTKLSPGQQSFIDRTRRASAMPPKELPDETEELSD